VLNVRQLARSDLHRAAEFCDRARAEDPAIEPFGDQLATLAQGARALLDLWRIAVDEEGAIQGIAFAALRASPRDGAPLTADAYVAVAPRFRRRGVGTRLCAPALQWAARERATLRARTPDGGRTGQTFLSKLGFRRGEAQLLLTWSRRRLEPAITAVSVRQLAPGDALPQLERLVVQAWGGMPDDFPVAPDEQAQRSREEGRLILLAEAGGAALGYLSGVWLGNTIAVEEVAVLPQRRREGIGRALLTAALRDAANAALWVLDSNLAARSLYRSVGFTEAGRRLVYELRHD
jgi:GNAT superfamily N-acetyltransferase